MPSEGALHRKDFFISYNGADEAWAEWIAWKLESAGYTTIVQAWDFRPGDNFICEVQKAAVASVRTLALLSPSYLASIFTRSEWAAALAQDPASMEGKLLPVRVAPCEVPGLLKAIVYCDLVGLGEEEAERALLKAVSGSRTKPSHSPPFPGGRPIAFPGQPQEVPSTGRLTVSQVVPQSARVARGAHLEAEQAMLAGTPLPPKPKRCIGRDVVIEDIVTTLLTDEPPAIPILGPGGIGKSTVSLAVLFDSRVAQRFVERRYFVRCETCLTAEALVTMTASAIGVQPGALLQERLLAELGQERALLVLDNLETPWVEDRDGTEEFLETLGGLPTLAVMASLRGQDWPAHPTWRSPIDLKPLEKNDARQLFLFNARPGHARDPYLDKLLDALEGLPLAIALLAHVSRRSPDLQELWEQWEQQHTALLQLGKGDSRLSSLEFSCDLSINSREMTPEARRLLSQLALLPNGMERGHLKALSRDMDPIQAARALRAVGLAADEGQRLGMLAPVREYIRHHYPPRPSDLDVLIDHYIGMATQLGPRVGWEGGMEASRVLSAEVANLESMILLGLQRTQPQPGIQAALALQSFIIRSGLGTPRVLKSARAAAHRMGDFLGEAHCIFTLGLIALERSAHDEARRHFDEALPLYRHVGDILGEAHCIRRMGDIALKHSEHDEARRHFDEALALYLRVGDILGEANCIFTLGQIALEHSEHDEARRRFDEARPLYHRVGAILGEANCISRIGDIALERSEYNEARMRFDEALSLYRHVGDIRGQANCISRMGDIALVRSGYNEARRRFDEALPLYRQVGDIRGEANCICSMGDIALACSTHDEARRRFDEALPLYRRVGDIFGEANCIFRAGQIALERSEHEEARRRFDEALPLYRRAGDLLGQSNCICALGLIALERSEHEEARRRFDEALPLYRRMGNILGEANCITGLGGLALERSEHEEARRRFDDALTLYRRVGDVLGEADCIKGLGDIALARLEYDEALSCFEHARPLYQSVNGLRGEAECLKGLGNIALAHSKPEQARAYLEEALSLCARIPQSFCMGKLHLELARLASGPEERHQHVLAAREAWARIRRDDLLRELSEEFGAAC